MENMEISMENSKQVSSTRRGGLRTMPFVVANEAFEKVASAGLHINMTIYLKNEFHFDNATAASILFWWGSLSNFLPILGAFISDSYLGRFRVIAIGTVISLAGQVMLWSTSLIPQARPPHCDHYPNNCMKPNSGQLAILFSSFVLMSIGAGGIRPCSLAFGADQLDNPDKPENKRILQSFFNWYYASVAVSVMFAIIVIVYIQTDFGWPLGFGIPVGLMFLSTALFFLGSGLYIKANANKSLMTGLAQAIAVAWKNKHLALPPKNSDGWYHHGKDSKLTSPTENLRFLNKACIIRNPEKDLKPEGSVSDSWEICTIEQVENLKALIKVLPIWSTGIIISVTISQLPFYVVQATTMDRRLFGDFKIPPATFAAFAVLTLGIWIAIYDRMVVPFVSKFTKNERGLSYGQRMGIGLFLSCMATAVAALVERNRRRKAINEGLADDLLGQVKMSAMWLVPQYCLTGLAEAFNAIGQIEFYYDQFPKSMASIAIALFALGSAIGHLLGSLIVQIVNHVTKRGGRVSWVVDNLNQGHYDYYYWILTVMSLVNFCYFILLTLFYDCPENDQNVRGQDEGIKEEDAGKSSLGLL